MFSASLPDLGLVAIGRNEGERLLACLESVVGHVSCVVYVDSGSSDGSVEMAKSLGVHVVELDMRVPFTAARARNEGWKALLALMPTVEFVQFVDGDCVVVDGWLQRAQAFMVGHPKYAVVSGRLRERYPERSIYNRLCDLEWDAPVGDAKACGGNAMLRVAALIQVAGFRDDLIAGEEPELCVRLRRAGWLINRLAAEMALHDAAITHFSQWWRRSKRAGYAYAEGAFLHGSPPERHWVRETRRAIFWGGVLPLLAFSFLLLGFSASLFLFIAYPIQIWRLRKLPGGWLQAFFLLLGKFPEAAGVLQFSLRRLQKTRSKLIEYK